MTNELIDQQLAVAIASRGQEIRRRASLRRALVFIVYLSACCATGWLLSNYSWPIAMAIVFVPIVAISILANLPTVDALQALKKYQYPQAQVLTKRALIWSVRLFPITSWALTYAIDAQLRLLYKDARFIEAEALVLLLAAVQKSNIMNSSHHPRNLFLANHLAISYLGQNRYAEASDIFRRLIPTAPNAKLRLTLTNGLGVSDFMDGKYDQAYDVLKTALPELKTKSHFDRRLSAYIKCTLGRVCAKKGLVDESEVLLEEAHSLREALPASPEERGISFQGLAELRSAQQRWEEAELNYRNAISLLRDSLAPEHWALILCLRDFAVVLEKIGKKEQALALLKEVSECRTRSDEKRRLAVDTLTGYLSTGRPLIGML
jgi:tetratricopeptide (TPR) repeat protein